MATKKAPKKNTKTAKKTAKSGKKPQLDPNKWITRPEDYKFFTTKKTPAGQITIAFLVLMLFIVGVIYLASLLAQNA
ncbi:MAG: hypothetical protein Q4E46_01775 [Candidatus Saccharibacteria bacterium]|nr:hypothetical protein [Candidatus Saccharibacteria bacterium]